MTPVKEFLHYRDLVWALVLRELKVRYRRSTIGFLWTMLQPLLTMLVLHVVFSTLFRIEHSKSGYPLNYPVYVLTGVLFWNFFSQSITNSMNSLRGNAHLLTKLPVPKAVFPLATVISGLVNLLLALVPLFVILAVTGQRVGPSLFFLPLSILIATVFTLGAGLLLSPLAAFFSDVVEMVGVILTLLFYLTPVIYPMYILDPAPPLFRAVVRFNPIRSILEVFRDPIHLSKIPPLSHFSIATAIALLALAVGLWVFRRSSDRIPFYL